MNQDVLKVINEEHIRHVIWHWSRGNKHGYQPGSFIQGLLDLYGRADMWNRGRLMFSFPDELHPLGFTLEELVAELERRHAK